MEMLRFTGKDNGPTIEEFIDGQKWLWPKHWKGCVWRGLQDEAAIWWSSLDNKKLVNLPNEEFEKSILDCLGSEALTVSQSRFYTLYSFFFFFL